MTAPAEPPVAPPRLLDRVRWHLRVKRYSIRTEQSYLDWIRRFILFHKKRHPAEMGEPHIAAFLSHLAIDQHVAASTQNQAFSALLFLYQQVLEKKLDFITGVERVRRPPKLPVVFTRAEARAVIAQLEGDYRMMAELALRCRAAPHGTAALARQRHRLWLQPNPRPREQGDA